MPLQAAAACFHTDVSLYLLGLTSEEEDLDQLLDGGNTLLHYAAINSDMRLLEALVQRGVNIEVPNLLRFTPLALAVRWSRMRNVRFLLTQYRARGRQEEDVLRELVSRLHLDCDRAPFPLISFVIEIDDRGGFASTQEDQREMVAFLVEEAGAEVWEELDMKLLSAISSMFSTNDSSRKSSVARRGKFFSLHRAAFNGNQAVLDYFLTDCCMPVDTCTDFQFTPLHFLAVSIYDEARFLGLVRWIVEEKGADVTCVDEHGKTAAQLAFNRGRNRIHQYLKAQEKQQVARKKEEQEKAAAAATMVKRMQEMEEATAALLLELEEEEQAAASSKKKKGKAGGGKKKKKSS